MLKVAAWTLGIVLVAGPMAYVSTEKSLDPRVNVPYQVWKLGIGGFSPNYVHLMGRDRHGPAVKGLTVAEAEKRLGVKLLDAMAFAPETYRGQAARQAWDAREERHYYFDDTANDWGWCLLVRGGRVVGFRYIKA